MTRTGREVRVRRYPAGQVKREDFDVVEVDVADPATGQVLVRNTWTSVDPGLRLRLRPDAPAGYFVAFPLERPMDGVMAVGEVVVSRADGFAAGDIVSHAQGWREYAVVDPAAEQLGGVGTLTRLDVSAAEAQWYLGPLGGMGLTAYAGLHVIDALRGGETVWVSAAAGAVGSLAVQVARLSGNRVIASAGSDEKVAWLRDDLGVDAFNYRDGGLDAQLRALAPEGIDAYFDSVGGDHLEAALYHLNRNGRVAMCGSISDYESEPRGPRNLFLAVSKDLTVRGFRASSNLQLMTEMQERMATWLRNGDLVHRETVFEGLESAPQALAAMIAGHTTGKTLVSIGSPLESDPRKRYDVTAVDQRMKDKVVFLSGATGGLGRATAARLAEEGAHLILTDLDEQECKSLVADLAVTPGNHVALRLDVADELQWVEVAESIQREYGRLDGLVNNAAIGSIATVEGETLERWEAVMSIGSTGVWLGMKHLGPLMETSGGGSIVNVSSILGTIGGLGNSAAYHAAKGAVRSLTKNAALHWATTGVRVNSLHPGFVGTAQLLERYEGTPRHEAMLANTPIGRLGRGEEIAAVVAFLISDDSTFMTGSEVYADGGYTAR